MKLLRPLIVIITITSIAQCYGQGFEVNIVNRPALTALRGNAFVKTYFDPACYFSAGLGATYFYKGNSFVNLQVLFDQKGGKGESTIVFRDDQNAIVEQGTISDEQNFKFVTIPVRWGKRFGKKIKYEFGAGFYTSLLLESHWTSEGMGQKFASETTRTFKKIDMGASFSFCMLAPIVNDFSMRFGVDDNLGLMNASKKPVEGNGTIKHNSIGLLVGLNYKLK